MYCIFFQYLGGLAQVIHDVEQTAPRGGGGTVKHDLEPIRPRGEGGLETVTQNIKTTVQGRGVESCKQ